MAAGGLPRLFVHSRPHLPRRTASQKSCESCVDWSKQSFGLESSGVVPLPVSGTQLVLHLSTAMETVRAFGICRLTSWMSHTSRGSRTLRQHQKRQDAAECSVDTVKYRLYFEVE